MKNHNTALLIIVVALITSCRDEIPWKVVLTATTNKGSQYVFEVVGYAFRGKWSMSRLMVGK
jgi:hypothetical protein